MKLLGRKLQQRIDAPGTSSKDALNLRPGYTEVVSQLLDSITAIAANANGFNVDLSQFGRPVSLANRHGAVSVLIKRILFSSAPRQVAKAIVGRFAVQVSRLIPRGAWATKGFKDQAVNIFHKRLTATPKNNLAVRGTLLSDSVNGARLPHGICTAIRPATPYFTLRGNRIARESRAMAESFIRQLRQIHSCDVITGSHA